MLLRFGVFLGAPDMNGLVTGLWSPGKLVEFVRGKTQWKDIGWVNGGVH